MMKWSMSAGVMMVLLVISGCGPQPTINCSSTAALKASIKAITTNLSDAEKSIFLTDCTVLISPEAAKDMNRIAANHGNGTARTKLELYYPLDGCTAQMVHKKAEEAKLTRQKKEEDIQAHGKADLLEREKVTKSPASIQNKATFEAQIRVAKDENLAKVKVVEIKCNEPGIENLSDHEWQVEGTLIGTDGLGAKIQVLWTARILFSHEQLECMDFTFRWRDRLTLVPAPEKMSPPKAPAVAPPPPRLGGGPAVVPDPPRKKKGSIREMDANNALEKARELEVDGQTTKAIASYRAITQKYRNTTAAKTAQDTLDKLQANLKK